MNPTSTINIQTNATMTAANTRYKFVELSIVTDESLEHAVNQWVTRGWQFSGIYFVTTEVSRRPSMAFVAFVRAEADSVHDLDIGDSVMADTGSRLTADSTPSSAINPQGPTAPIGIYLSADENGPRAPEATEQGTQAEHDILAEQGSNQPIRVATIPTATPEEITDDEPTGIYYE